MRPLSNDSNLHDLSWEPGRKLVMSVDLGEESERIDRITWMQVDVPVLNCWAQAVKV